MFSYKPLLKLMIDRQMNKTDLRNMVGISTVTVAKISKNEYISLDTLDKLCAYFDAQPGEILEYVEERK